ncbi:MAG: FUSC family protein [[Clostridium] innocuum]
MDSFEFRFASRLSLVLLLGFLFARLFQLDHSYWLVLNAFLLLQPMYEESAYRLKTRFIGTILGCTIIYLVLPHIPGIEGHFLFASIVVSLMYCATPGTWMQAMFSTCFCDHADIACHAGNDCHRDASYLCSRCYYSCTGD